MKARLTESSDRSSRRRGLSRRGPGLGGHHYLILVIASLNITTITKATPTNDSLYTGVLREK